MNCLIIGGGGIGSWMVTRLARLRDHGQLNSLDGVVIADSDEVEDKNLPYQNFDTGEIMDSKALCLDARFGFTGIDDRIIHQQQLESFDIIICAVDNTAARRLVFEHCRDNPKKYFIDLRAEGTAVWGITSDAGWAFEKLIKSLGNESAEDKSCQLAYELEAGIIQLGNTIIAEIGTQWLLNYLRHKKNPVVFSHRF